MSRHSQRRLVAAAIILLVTAILVVAQWGDFVDGIRRATGALPYGKASRPGLTTANWGGSK